MISEPKSKYSVDLPWSPTVLVIRKIGEEPEVEQAFSKVIEYLLEFNLNVRVEARLIGCLSKKVNPFKEEKCHKIGLVITIGGDGTVIWAARLFKHSAVPPMLTFNMGSLSFMTYYSILEYKEIIQKVLHCTELEIDLKQRFQCIYKDNEEVIDYGQACNEICIDRGPGYCMTELELYVNGEYATTAYGDGLLISTPCGSTAYSLSAGGSIVHFGVPAILLTPICPHSLSFRPLLLPDYVTVTIKVPNDARQPSYVSVDGHTRFKLKQGSSIDVMTSHYPIPRNLYSDISLGKNIVEWLGRLNSVLRWNERRPQKPLVLNNS